MQKRTIYTLPKDATPTGTFISDLITAHEKDITTFRKLESYVDDCPQITRQTPTDLLTINNFAQYITSINTGYLIGNPVDYRTNDKTSIDPITENYRQQSVYELDADLETDCSMFGQAFENVFVDETAQVVSAKLSVYNTIVVYDDTFKHDKLFAVYYAPFINEAGKEVANKYDLTIWTKTHIITAMLDGDQLQEDPIQPPVEHYFGDVPVVHFMNNKRMKGDYEPVISLIDAYNILQSDRVIDREKLVDAILAFYGANLQEDDRKAIKENRVVGLPEGAKAEYIVKQVNEADADVLRKTLAADIHKFSMTPDLTDDSFGDSPSGVSILYKLLAFEQNIKTKERQFEAGLRDRFNLYSAILTKQGKMSTALSAHDIDIVFRRALPKNDVETSTMITNLEGVVSDETLISQLSFVTDASKEVEKANKQKQANVSNFNFATSNFPPANSAGPTKTAPSTTVPPKQKVGA